MSRAGFTLVEALIATVLAGMTVMLLFTVITAAPKAIVPLNHNDQALQAAAALSESLKNYVSADVTAATQAEYAPKGSWKINAADNCGDALAVCDHGDMPSSWLPQELIDMGATIKYGVEDGGNGVLIATIIVHWEEPK